MFKPRISVLFACLALAVLVVAPMSAQQAPGKIAGTVRIAGGGALVGATVTVTNQETGATRAVRSLTGGAYESADVPPGLYTVSAEFSGFRKAIQKDQRLTSGATLTLDFALELKVAEAVTVTAMKREETVFSTPVSVAAPTEEVMRERGMTDIEDISENVANFAVQNLGPGQSQVSIRGVSSGQIARDQPGVKEGVGTYLDESVISLSLFNPDMDLFDMNRVEVLRGPQGTLFGSGSVGGTLRYITNQPQLGVASVFGEVGGEAIDGGGTGGNVKVGFNSPLGSMAAVRVIGYYNRLAGWMDAVHPQGSLKPGEFTVEKNVNSGDRMGLRIAFDLAPIENLTITPRFVYQKLAMEGWNRIDNYNILANPFTTTQPAIQLGPRQLFTQMPEPTTDKFQLGDLNIKYKFDNDMLLTSITSFTNRSILVVRDATALTGSVTGGSLGLPASIYTLNAPLNDATQASGWTQEVRLSSDKGRFKWVAGGFYGYSKRAYQQTLPVKGFEDLCAADCPPVFNTGGGFPIIPTQGTYAPKDNLYWSDLHYKLREYGFFGEGTFVVTDQFSLTAGLRYYNYSDDKTLIFDGLFAPLGLPAPPVATVQAGTFKSDGVAPRFIASYKVNDSTTINAQASKGFRLGGVNDPILLNICSPQDVVTFGGVGNWKDETEWNYEIGSKSRFMGGRGSVNASAFYVDVKDLQVVVTAGTCSSRLVFNAPKARSVGGELEFALAPTDNFDFSLSGSYTDAKFTSSLSGSADTIAATGIRDGNRLPSVPKFQMAASATYQQDVVPGFRGYVNANYHHVGDRYTQAVDQEAGVGTIKLYDVGGPLTQSTFTFNPLLPAYDIVNMRLGVRHGVWDIAFYVNNIGDERALLALDRERGLRARQGFLTNQPRTFGLSTRADF